MSDFHLILATGTQVVALVEVKGTDGKPVHPRGALGIVVQSPGDHWHKYRVRFPDGFEAGFHRQDLALLSDYQQAGGGADHSTIFLKRYVIYRCVVGSRAYGLDEAHSDTDRRGIYLPPARLHWSLFGVPDQLQSTDPDEVYWEAQRFCALALKANPSVLECLFTPLTETVHPLAAELLQLRHCFLSKMIYQTYTGYVLSQFKKIQADLRNKGDVKWKHVMHLLRLLLGGINALERGEIAVDVGEHKDQLLAIRRGEAPIEQCEAWRQDLHTRFDSALPKSPLPDRPDYRAVNDWLLRARRHMAQNDLHDADDEKPNDIDA